MRREGKISGFMIREIHLLHGMKLNSCLTCAPNDPLQVDEARDILAHVVICHVPAHKYNFQNKLAYFAVMLRRMLQAVIDPTLVDDRDYYGNKRLELAGGWRWGSWSLTTIG